MNTLNLYFPQARVLKLDYETMVKSPILFLITSCLKGIKLQIFLAERWHLSTLNKTLATVLWAQCVVLVLVCIRQCHWFCELWFITAQIQTGDFNKDRPSNFKWKQSCITSMCSTVYYHVKWYDNNPIPHRRTRSASSFTCVSCGPE